MKIPASLVWLAVLSITRTSLEPPLRTIAASPALAIELPFTRLLLMPSRITPASLL